MDSLPLVYSRLSVETLSKIISRAFLRKTYGAHFVRGMRTTRRTFPYFSLRGNVLNSLGQGKIQSADASNIVSVEGDGDTIVDI